MSDDAKRPGLVVCDHCPEFPHPLNDDNTPCKHPRPAPKVESKPTVATRSHDWLAGVPQCPTCRSRDRKDRRPVDPNPSPFNHPCNDRWHNGVDPEQTPIPGFAATEWVELWFKTISEHPGISTSWGTMLTWFSAAIMRGWDEARSRDQESLKHAKLLLQSVLMEWAHQGVWNEKVCPRCEKHALPTNDLCLIHTIFKFLGIDPNHPLSPEEEREWSKSRTAYLKSIKSGE